MNQFVFLQQQCYCTIYYVIMSWWLITSRSLQTWRVNNEYTWFLVSNQESSVLFQFSMATTFESQLNETKGLFWWILNCNVEYDLLLLFFRFRQALSPTDCVQATGFHEHAFELWWYCQLQCHTLRRRTDTVADKNWG